MSKKVSMYPVPTSQSRTRKGTRPNDSKKAPVIGSGKNRQAKGYHSETKSWD